MPTPGVLAPYTDRYGHFLMPSFLAARQCSQSKQFLKYRHADFMAVAEIPSL